ncbi:hypothetical protein [Actinoplanes teichomyceticus]|uniref:AbiTii domain-containing protein n=1 Tax=Actinoplanes teichomyceticus TaxID=1867 RepID=UPI000F09EBF8|nr:hypothetical protein [Actinoplanes teichomyceticus]
MTTRADRLLQELETGALDSQKPIADLLRKAIALGGQSGSAELRDWARRELQGYAPEDELPEYRKIVAPLTLDGMTIHGIIKGQQISSMNLPDFAQDRITDEIELRMGIGQIEKLAPVQGADHVKLQPQGAADLAAFMNQTGAVKGHIERIYWSVAPVALAGVVDHVRTMLTVLVAEIRATAPTGAATPPAEVATNAIHFAVTGTRNKINFTAPQGTVVTSHPQAGEDDSPKPWLRIAGAVLVGLVTIAAGVFALMQVQGWKFK